MTANQSRNATVEQSVVQAHLAGDLFELPAGPLQFALGTEYREEKSDAINDALTVRGLNSSNASPNVTPRWATPPWEGRFELVPVEQVRLRGSIARAVRAPNVLELYNPGIQTFAQVNDPCAGVTATTTGVTAENCRSIPAIAARIATEGPFTLTQPELQGTAGFLGGNPDLQESSPLPRTTCWIYATAIPTSRTILCATTPCGSRRGRRSRVPWTR